MITPGNLLAHITRLLDQAGIRYMAVGSLASSFHGEPRTTRDIDLVIDPTAISLTEFLGALPRADFYVDAGAASEALDRRTSFNIVEIETGWKVDLMIRRDRPFSRDELDRRIAVRLLGTDTYVATAEDTIIAKLEWAREGESERQLRDVASILAVSGEGLDHGHLERWIAALELADVWDQAKRLVGEGYPKG